MKTTADLAKEAAISRRPEFLFGLYFTNRDDDSLDTVEDEIPRGDVLLERVDCEAAEAAERQIDAYIEKRSREKRNDNEIEALWSASEARERERRHQENRDLWHSYHLDQAERLERTAASMAEEHRPRAAALSEEEAS